MIAAPFWCPTPCSHARSARGSLWSCLALVVAWGPSKEAFLCRHWRGRARGHRRGPWLLSFVAEPAQRSLPTTETQTWLSRSEPALNNIRYMALASPIKCSQLLAFTQSLGGRFCVFDGAACIWIRVSNRPGVFVTED